MTTGAPVRSADVATDLAMSVSLTIVALYAYQSSFGGTEYLLIGIAGAVLAALLTTILNARGAHVLVSVGALFVLHILVGGSLALRAQATAGFLPSLDTLRGASEAVVSGWKELLTTAPPVGGIGSLLVLPFFCGCFGAGLANLLARRVRSAVAATAPPAAVLAFGILAGLPSPVSVVMHGAVFAGSVLLWVSLRHRRTRVVVQLATSDRRRRSASAVGLVLSAATIGFAVGDRLPFAHASDRVILRDTIEPPFDPFDYPSPLSGYRHFIKHFKKEVLFTIEGLPEGVPVRLAAMDQYDGVVWQVTGGAGAKRGASGYFERVGTEVAPQFDGERATITVTIENWSEVWLPIVGEVISIRFQGPRARELSEAYRYSSTVDTAALQQRLLRPGDSYVMEVVLPTAGSDVEKGLLVADSSSSAKDFVPEPLTTWVAPVVQKDTDSFKRVKSIVARLQGGYYSDGEEKELDSLGGHSQGRLTDFVNNEIMVGNAEQYAAAAALMLRSLDVSSRVVMGFIPTEYTSDIVEVTGRDTEAWVETSIDAVGWVYFRVTPERSRTVPEQAPQPKPQPERNTQVPPPPPVLVEDPSSEPATESAAQQDAKKGELPKEGGGLPAMVIVGALAVGVPALVVGGPLALVIYLKARRRRHRRRDGAASTRVANGFHEVLDFASDLGRPIPVNSTRRELTGFVGAPSASALAVAADEFVFAPLDLTDDQVESFWSSVDVVLDDMRRQVSRVDRWKARISLVSLKAARAR